MGEGLSTRPALPAWRPAADVRGEPIDGLAAAFARASAEAVLYRTDTIDSEGFLTTLAEALVLSGLAMAVAGSSRPCSGGDHEILHAVDQLFPGTSTHGELAGVGALFCAFLRGDADQQRVVDSCLRRHELP